MWLVYSTAEHAPPETHQLHGSPRMTVISGVVSSHRSGSLPLGSPLRTTWAPRVASPQGTRGHTDSSPAGSHNSTMTAGVRTVAPPPGGRGRWGASPRGSGGHTGSSPGDWRKSTRGAPQVGHRFGGGRRPAAGPHTAPTRGPSTARWTPQGPARRSRDRHGRRHGGDAQSHDGRARRRAPHAHRRGPLARPLAPHSSRAPGPAARAALSTGVSCLWPHPCRASRSPSSCPRLLALEDAASSPPIPWPRVQKKSA